jgi:PEP-CTERM motif
MMNTTRRVVALTALIWLAHGVGARGGTTYNIANYPADQNGNTVSGSITTDGVIGTLAPSDILSWTVTINSTTFTSGDSGADMALSPTDLNATSTAITLASPLGLQSSFLALAAIPTGGGRTDEIAWTRGFDFFGEDLTKYVGRLNGRARWATPDPAMGGTDPWVIAAISPSAVPEPTSLLLAAFGIGGVIACVLVRERREQRREALA